MKEMTKMKLTDKYVHAVTKLLPEEQRQDIEREIRSLIEDMMDQKGGHTEENEILVLKELGHPRTMADKYLDKPNYLIGPELFGTYTMLLKVLIPISIIVTLIGTMYEVFTADKELIDVFTMIITGVFNAPVVTFGCVTLIFAVFERKSNVGFVNELRKEWNPKDLPDIEKPSKPISRVGTVIGMGFLFLFFTIFNRYMHLFGIYYKEGTTTMFAPIFDAGLFRTYLPYINGIFALQFVLSIVKLVYNRWNYPIAASNLVVNLLAMVVAIMILRDPGLIDFNAFAKIPGLQNDLSADSFRLVQIILLITIPLSYLIDSIQGFRNAYSSSRGK
jgi:hypothetical protein